MPEARKEDPCMTEDGAQLTAAAATSGHPSGDNRFKMLDATMKRHRSPPTR